MWPWRILITALAQTEATKKSTTTIVEIELISYDMATGVVFLFDVWRKKIKLITEFNYSTFILLVEACVAV